MIQIIVKIDAYHMYVCYITNDLNMSCSTCKWYAIFMSMNVAAMQVENHRNESNV